MFSEVDHLREFLEKPQQVDIRNLLQKNSFSKNMLNGLLIELAQKYIAQSQFMEQLETKYKTYLQKNTEDLNVELLKNSADLEYQLFQKDYKLKVAQSDIEQLRNILEENFIEIDACRLVKQKIIIQQTEIEDLTQKIKYKQNDINELKQMVKQLEKNIQKLQKNTSTFSRVTEFEKKQLQQQVYILGLKLKNLEPIKYFEDNQNQVETTNIDPNIKEFEIESNQILIEGETFWQESVGIIRKTIEYQNNPKNDFQNKLMRLRKQNKELEIQKALLIEIQKKFDQFLEKLGQQQQQNKNSNSKIDNLVNVYTYNKQILHKIFKIFEFIQQIINDILTQDEINTLGIRVNQQQVKQNFQVFQQKPRNNTIQQIQIQKQKDLNNKKQKMKEIHQDFVNKIEGIFKENIYKIVSEIDAGIQNMLQYVSKEVIKGNVEKSFQTLNQFLSLSQDEPNFKIFSGGSNYLDQVKNQIKNQNALPGVLIVSACTNQQEILELIKGFVSAFRGSFENFSISIQKLIG